MAASTLRQSDTYLGAQFRRLRTKLGAPRAIKAMLFFWLHDETPLSSECITTAWGQKHRQ
jgi:hypothetical protein